jgi:heat shock protein HslJ
MFPLARRRDASTSAAARPGRLAPTIVAFALLASATLASAQVPMPFPVGRPFMWLGTATADLKKRMPPAPARYLVQFDEGGVASIRLDCNIGRTRWTRQGSRLELAPIAGTKKACDHGSMDVVFAGDLAQVAAWRFDGKELILLGRDGRAMLFVAQKAQ